MEPAYSARLEPAEAQIEFFGQSIDGDKLLRKHVLHYTLDRGVAERIEPVAFTARDFVDEWLTRPWTQAIKWSSPTLADWHGRLHKDFVSDEFKTAMRCTKPGEWQISVDLDHKLTYFLLSEDAGYHYTMRNVSIHPRPDCSVPEEP